MINIIMRINDIINETTSGSIASVAMGLGGGDPAASIYGKSKKKKKKTEMIRRPAMEKQNGKQ